MGGFAEFTGSKGTPFLVRIDAVEYVLERPSKFVPDTTVRVIFTAGAVSSFEVVEVMEEIKKRLGIPIVPRAETLAIR